MDLQDVEGAERWPLGPPNRPTRMAVPRAPPARWDAANPRRATPPANALGRCAGDLRRTTLTAWAVVQLPHLPELQRPSGNWWTTPASWEATTLCELRCKFMEPFRGHNLRRDVSECVEVGPMLSKLRLFDTGPEEFVSHLCRTSVGVAPDLCGRCAESTHFVSTCGVTRKYMSILC